MAITTAACGRYSNGVWRVRLGLAAALAVGSGPAHAAELDMLDAELAPIMMAALIVIVALFATMMTTTRRRHAQRESELGADLERTRAELDRVKQFLAGEPQIVVVWDRADA